MGGKLRGESLRQYSQRMGMEHLLREWDAEKNKPLTPDDITCGSRRKVWWRCARGHSWTSSVEIRCSGSGCPYCAGKRPVVGETDLATLFPNLAREWHPTKNGELRPTDLTAGSDKKVWWRCDKGHEWEARINTRTLGGGCPVCSGRQVIPGVNDLATWSPALAGEWSDRNGALTPQQVRPFSNKKVWWECERGHLWQATVNARVSNASGCPYCANRKVLPGFNDLATREPRLAAQWHPSLNGALTPQQVVPGSHEKVWWICPEGHSWQATVVSRSGKKKPGCPICAGNTSKGWRERHERVLAGLLPTDES